MKFFYANDVDLPKLHIEVKKVEWVEKNSEIVGKFFFSILSRSTDEG